MRYKSSHSVGGLSEEHVGPDLYGAEPDEDQLVLESMKRARLQHITSSRPSTCPPFSSDICINRKSFGPALGRGSRRVPKGSTTERPLSLFEPMWKSPNSAFMSLHNISRASSERLNQCILGKNRSFFCHIIPVCCNLYIDEGLFFFEMSSWSTWTGWTCQLMPSGKLALKYTVSNSLIAR